VSGSLAPGKRPTHKLVLGPLPHTPKCPCVSPLGPMLAEGQLNQPAWPVPCAGTWAPAD
jgi:hypothetical protein